MDEEDRPRAIMKEERSDTKRRQIIHDPEEKEEMEDIMLMHKDIGGDNFSMNKYIADELTKLMKIYANERDIGRKIAYMKASAVIRNLDKEI